MLEYCPNPVPLTQEMWAMKTKTSSEVSCIGCESCVRCEGRTGVEMEALTAVQIALLTIYDMCKAVDRGMVIEAVQLIEKQGGKSGNFVASKLSY